MLTMTRRASYAGADSGTLETRGTKAIRSSMKAGAGREDGSGFRPGGSDGLSAGRADWSTDVTDWGFMRA